MSPSEGSWTKAVGPEGTKRSVSADVARRVWIAAGGRCTFCNKNLVVDEVTTQDILIGQLAHIVGWSTSKGSPRGADADLRVSERDTAENLMLLCCDQHQVIDHRSMWQVYDAPTLRRLKRSHEATIRRLTGLRDNNRSTVVRVVGSIAGVPSELSRRTVAQAMLDRNLFPDYALLGYDAEVEVDLRNLPGEADGAALYWTAAQEHIAVVGARIKSLVASGDVARLSVFALARIPVLVKLGSAIGEALTVDLYPTRRSANEGFGWTPTVPTATFGIEVARPGDGRHRKVVAVSISVSGVVDTTSVAVELDDGTTIYEIELTSGPTSVEVICSQESLDNFTKCWREFLAQVESEHPDAEAIAVFPAVPVTAAIAMGRALMRGAHPPLRIYDLSHHTRRYEFALEVRRGDVR